MPEEHLATLPMWRVNHIESALNNPRRLMRQGSEAEIALWDLQRPGILMPKSCKS
ncbi:hypothetical protein [Paraburkholderia nodosa]|uniref:hypothetical protein n=1 Tax=Paraburkholderia nodosa TaxID=392320 RepID=UPI0012B688BA|nr:hypothetical protein [Paraburkholderia nodosa]